MIIKINGQFWYDTENQISDEVVVLKKSNKLRNFAITLWTTSSLLFTRSLHAGSFYEEMQPLTHVFQDIALGLGILAALAGFILLGVKKRVGKKALMTTGLVVGGVFLVPSILMLIAIIGTTLNDALTEAFESIRGSKNIKDVMGE